MCLMFLLCKKQVIEIHCKFYVESPTPPGYDAPVNQFSIGKKFLERSPADFSFTPLNNIMMKFYKDNSSGIMIGMAGLA